MADLPCATANRDTSQRGGGFTRANRMAIKQAKSGYVAFRAVEFSFETRIFSAKLP
jgi:hypothetical protein